MFRLLRRLLPLASGLATLSGLPRSAAATVALPISVEREPGAEDCPDTAGLVRRVRDIIGRVSLPESTPYRVTFSHGAQSFTAAIRSGADHDSVRFLDAREPNCGALAHATAIALAVLFDADLDGKSAVEVSAPAPPPPVSAAGKRPDSNRAESAEPLPATVPAPRERKSALRPVFSLGAVALVGVLRPAVFGFVGDAGLPLGRVQVTLGALWITPQTIELAPGRVRETLASSQIRLCLALAGAGALRLDGCSGALIGAATAEARGFSSNERHTKLFLAFPAELSLAARAGRIGWQLATAALVLAPPHEFAIEGRGPTYRPLSVAGMIALRLFIVPSP
jgi:hypothetical protein